MKTRLCKCFLPLYKNIFFTSSQSDTDCLKSLMHYIQRFHKKQIDSTLLLTAPDFFIKIVTFLLQYKQPDTPQVLLLLKSIISLCCRQNKKQQTFTALSCPYLDIHTHTYDIYTYMYHVSSESHHTD